MILESGWRDKLAHFITDEKNKVSKVAGARIMRIFSGLEMEANKLKIKITYLNGRLDEREYILKMARKEQKKDTYADKARRPLV